MFDLAYVFYKGLKYVGNNLENFEMAEIFGKWLRYMGPGIGYLEFGSGATIPNQAGPRVADRGEAFRYGGQLRNKPDLPGRISSPGPTGDDPTRTGRVGRRHCHPQRKSPRCPTTGSSCGQEACYSLYPQGRKTLANKNQGR